MHISRAHAGLYDRENRIIPGEKKPRAEWGSNELNPRMTKSLGIEPGPHDGIRVLRCNL